MELSQSETREVRLLKTFATVADTLVVGYDTVDLMQTLVERCGELLDATDAGILLADSTGRLEVLASTDERSQLVELMQLSAGEGPCVECFSAGIPVSVPDVEASANWPLFRAECLKQGYNALHAFPLRLRNTTIGSLNLFRDHAGTMSELDRVAAQALADVATIGIMQERAVREQTGLEQQIQRAFDTRAVIEQAKGIIAYGGRIPVDKAFDLLRNHARREQRTLVSVASDVLERRLTL